jgi:hypothetical protein
MSKFTVVYDACVLYRILDDRKPLVLGWKPDNVQVAQLPRDPRRLPVSNLRVWSLIERSGNTGEFPPPLFRQ